MMDFKPDVLFVGDLHLHERAEFPGPIGENPRLLDGLSILDQIVSLVQEHNLKYVIFTGDIFELKDKIPNHILTQFAMRLWDLQVAKAEVIALRGNHDFKLPQFSTTRIFLNNIMFVDDVFTIGLTNGEVGRSISFVPFYREQKEFREKWEEYHKSRLDNPPNVLMFHNELPGVKYNEKMSVPKDWDFPVFDNTIYIGGHIHKPQILSTKKNNIIFIGTPYQIDFDDVSVGNSYHVYLYDLRNNELQQKTLKYPKFLDLDYNNITFIQIKGNYIRVKATVQPQERPKVKQFKETLLERGAKGVQLKVKYLTESVSRIKAEKTDHRGVISQYLKGSDTTLDKERLLKTGLDLIERAKT